MAIIADRLRGIYRRLRDARALPPPVRGVATVPTYRIVHIDKATRERAVPPETFDAPTDDLAISTALERADGHIVEVWKCNQRLIQFQRNKKL